MKITSLELKNFRNYSNAVIQLNDQMNIFVGDNAQGKTNILESIIYLALTKSHRVINNPNVIMFGKNFSKLSCTVKKNKLLTKLDIHLFENEKKLYINKTNIKKIGEYISNLNVIIFTPDDLEIIKGSPNVRRNLLNIQLSQISRNYLNTYNEYNKILKTRNEFLRQLSSGKSRNYDYLDILTDKLVEKSVLIYQMRNEYINFINEEINMYFSLITGNDGLSVKYQPNISFKLFDEDEIINNFKSLLKDNLKREVQYGMTMYGPHRDDFSFFYDENDLKLSGSQGQQKISVLCFKLAEISIFKNYSGFYPVLLLDDIFSELDIKKRNKLLEVINGFKIQSIITTTDLKNISKKYLSNTFIFEVKNAIIGRK